MFVERDQIRVYRGQKTWSLNMGVTASSMRKSGGSSGDQEAWTDQLLAQFRFNITGAYRGDVRAIKRLEAMLLDAQGYAFANPFVSCSYSYTIARSFANAGDTQGFILTVEGPWHYGVDFEYLRTRFNLYADAFDHLKEFGIPKELQNPFQIVQVELLSDPRAAAVRVYPP